MIYRFYLKEKKIEKIEKLVAKLHDNAEYFIQIKKFVTRAKSWSIFKKVDRVIKDNQNAWLKPYIDMSADLRKKAKSSFFKKTFSRW